MVRSAANKKKILSKLMRVIKQRKKSQSLEKITKQNEVQNGSFKTLMFKADRTFVVQTLQD